MTEEEIKSIAETECKKLLKSEKGYNGISFQEFWAEGAKWGIANAIEWHDLRKNPDDLPKEFDVIKKAFGIYPEEKAIHIVLNQDGEYVHYLSGDWYYIYDEDIVGDSSKVDVIAWCELPQFKE